jgi:tripeptide aminopeptidase
VTRASEVERRRLGGTFERLCRIASPSRDERACADAVIAELGELGIAAEEDRAGEALAGNCGNVLARVPGRGEETLLLCAHLDTVPLAAPVDPIVVDDGWENANDGILGADNKAAVAVLLALAHRLVTMPAAIGLELLFTVGEEVGLAGAKAFEVGKLRSSFGYVFDHASPIGEIVTASPTYYSLEAELRGVAAHAGIRPEDGRSAIVAAARAITAMRLGRLDERTTANIGRIDGGDAANVVAERCRVVGEARSLDRETAEQTVTTMIDALQDAANAPDCECDVDVLVARVFDGYRTAAGAEEIAVAEAALEACGYRPQAIVTGGGSDANALITSGFRCVNLANGTERNHQPDERVSVAALEGMLDVSLALVDRAAEAAC